MNFKFAEYVLLVICGCAIQHPLMVKEIIKYKIARFRSFSPEPLNGSIPYLAGMYLWWVPIAERKMVSAAALGAAGRGVKVPNFTNFAKIS
jgi:hypothetical protein